MVDFLNEGGWIMWFIALLSVLALGLIIERFYAYFSLRTDNARFYDELDDMVQRGAVDEAIAWCRAGESLVGKLAADLLENRHLGLSGLRKLTAAEIDLRHQPDLQAWLGTLATFAKAAPMLGLLGTVLGMMKAFDKIAGQTQANPKDLAGDIAVALNTTFGGLLVAIVIVFFLSHFRSRTRRFEIDLERCGTHVQDLLSRAEGAA